MSSSKSSRSKKDESGNPDLNCASIGNYVFQKTLGEGNFAKVKLAKHKLTGAEVAIKVIDKTTLDEKKLGKLYREVRIMKMLHHPNIVKLYEVIETKTTMFLVMEYSSGGELYDYLVVHGKMKEKEARAKFRQILSAVGYCHKKRVIHRDLKAENLLLDANLDIKIADFGFSNMFDPDSKLDTFCGSPPYAAPELFQGRRYTGPEVDIWSLGVILYVLTTGCLPFDGKNLQEMRESVCKGKYRIPFYLSDSCEKLLRKMLVRDPVKRASLDIFLDDPWINEGYDHSPISKDLSEQVSEDDNIIRLIEAKYHVSRDTILQALRGNVYDDIAAIYYLLYHEKETRGRIEADSPTTVSLPSPTAEKQAEREKSYKAPAMDVIQEDSVAPSNQEDTLPALPQAQLRAPKAAPTGGRRRFTVGNEQEIQKMADEDTEANKFLNKLRNNVPQPSTPSKEDDSSANRGSMAGAVPLRDPAARAAANRMSMLAPHTFKDHSAAPVLPTPQPVSKERSKTAIPQATPQTPSTPTDGGAEKSEGDRRKRHNTIVGILRNTIYRPSESSNPPASPTMAVMSPSADKGGDIVGANAEGAAASDVADSEAFEPVKPGEEGKPRSLRFTFNSNTTSSKPPEDIVKEVISVCTKNGIAHKLASRYLVECSTGGDEGVKFEVEICRLPRLKNLHGLRFKRIQGSSNDYKEVCEKLVGLLQL